MKKGTVFLIVVAFIMVVSGCSVMGDAFIKETPSYSPYNRITGEEMISLLQDMDFMGKVDIRGIDRTKLYVMLNTNWLYDVLTGPIFGHGPYGKEPAFNQYVSKHEAITTGKQPYVCHNFAVDTVEFIKNIYPEAAIGYVGLPKYIKAQWGPFVFGKESRANKAHGKVFFITRSYNGDLIPMILEPQAPKNIGRLEDVVKIGFLDIKPL